MLGSARHPLFAAKDVRDLHEMIVDDVGEMVRRQAVGLQQHLHVDALILELDRPAAQVFDDADAFVRDAQPHDVGLAGRLAPRDLLGRISQAQSVVPRRLSGGSLRDAHLLEALRACRNT